jgi:hypothetical protein
LLPEILLPEIFLSKILLPKIRKGPAHRRARCRGGLDVWSQEPRINFKQTLCHDGQRVLHFQRFDRYRLLTWLI